MRKGLLFFSRSKFLFSNQAIGTRGFNEHGAIFHVLALHCGIFENYFSARRGCLALVYPGEHASRDGEQR